MKKYMLFLAAILIYEVSVAQDITREWIETHYTKTEYHIAMRDGVTLYTAVYAPRDTTLRCPLLMTRSAYSCSPYGEGYVGSLWGSYLRDYAREGYIFVFQDVRGRWMSQGDFVNIRPLGGTVDESTDAYDTVDWLVRNIVGNNGRVGVFGNSYGGFYAIMAAIGGHPAIRAVSPQAPVLDWFMGDDVHHNGAMILTDSFRFLSSMGRTRPGPGTKMPRTPQFVDADEYTFYMRHATLANLTALFQGKVPFWTEVISHPDYDDWWQTRNYAAACRDLRPALLIVGGLFDAEDLYGTWNLHAAVQKNSPDTECHLVIGPWEHGGWRSSGAGNKLGDVSFGKMNLSGYFQRQIEEPFFNYYLKDVGSLDTLAAATIFFSGENRWRTFDSWPPKQTTARSLYLQEDGGLGWERPTIRNSYSSYLSDPANPVPYMSHFTNHRRKEYMVADQSFVQKRADVLTFQTEPLEREVTLAGALRVVLETMISTTDADFVVKLIDVYPANEMKGYQLLVRGDLMRGRYRRSFSKPEPFAPDKMTEVAFTMPDVAHTFGRGHRIAVQVQSSWFPLFDRNPQQFINICECGAQDFIPSRVNIFHEKRHPSRIEVQTLER